MPKLLSLGEAQRKRPLERRLARQKKGSNRRNRTIFAIAKLSAREVDMRRDWIEKTTTNLVGNYDLIVIEGLKIKNMIKSASDAKESPGKKVSQKPGLSRAVSSQAWSLFRKRLQDKAANSVSQVIVIAINPKFTSRTCLQCEHTARENRHSQAIFSCVARGYEANADFNSAQNILASGLAVTGRRGIPHSLAHSGPMKRELLNDEVA